MNAPTVGGMFDGAGLLALGLHQAGLQHRWLCEADPWRRELLRKRFPGIPIYEDVRDIDQRCERVDWIAGGFPCKGVSTAGKRNGFDHAETVLWREMARAIRDLEPRGVVIENVANLLALADGALWSEVLGDLAALGFDVEWDVLPAAAVGAPHLRERVFAVATNSANVGSERAGGSRDRGAGLADGGAPTPDAEREPSELRRGHGPVHGPPSPAKGEARQRERDRLAAGSGGASPPDARGGRQHEQPLKHRSEEAGQPVPSGHDAERRGVRVEWGTYGPAVQRWEAVHGPAPEPLVRRVDDGPADVRRLRARVDRSRLSALGDGVHVYVGRLVGEAVMRS